MLYRTRRTHVAAYQKKAGGTKFSGRKRVTDHGGFRRAQSCFREALIGGDDVPSDREEEATRGDSAVRFNQNVDLKSPF